MKVEITGKLRPGVTAKDITLSVIGATGTAGGTGYVMEYRGEAIQALSMEGRMTLCNLSIEGGARAGLIGRLRPTPSAPPAIRNFRRSIVIGRLLRIRHRIVPEPAPM